MTESVKAPVRTEPQIVQKPAFWVAGLRYAGRNQHGEIPALWDNAFLPRMSELDALRIGGDCYGACRELPDMPPDAGFEYLACVQVAPSAVDHLPPGMMAWEAPAMAYAVLPADDVPGIGPVCDYFYSQWLPSSREYGMGEGLMFEFYPETYPQDHTILLYFPIRRK